MILAKLLAAVARTPSVARRDARAAALVQAAGAVLQARDSAGAERKLREALAVAPEYGAAHAQLAALLTGQRRFNEALEHYRAADLADALDAGTLHAYVRVLLDRARHEEALDLAERAAVEYPGARESWLALGLARHARHDYEQALACFERAAALGPADAELHTRCGIALHQLGRLDEALGAFEAALVAVPGYALARFHQSLVLLLTGDYARAWLAYEARLASGDLALRPRAYARWDGATTPEKTVLLYGEQGLGDEMMFASCIPDMLGAGVRCVVECHPKLERLFARSFPDATVYAARDDKSIPQSIEALGIDCELPLGSLPLHFRSTAAAFPRHRGYLVPDSTRVAVWRARLASLGPGLKVGISWRGGTEASRGSLRSIDLLDWLPILRTPGIRWISLQYTAGAEAEVRALRECHGVAVEHWTEVVADYEETAALVATLDLTVSVCTALVHLAGALGRPVWVLAPCNPEWRYGERGAEMAWYPSARVFRQAERRQWAPVVSAVAEALREPQLWNGAGVARLERRELDAAQACFERALELSPALAEAHSNLGVVLIEKNDDQNGERHLREALALDPDLVAALENLAVLLSARYEHTAAEAAWDALLALKPSHAGAHAAKAMIALHQGRFDAAEALTRRALELGADRETVLTQQASFSAATGETERAKRLWAELGSHSDSPEVQWEKAVCALASGAYAEGWSWYDARLRREISPSRPYAFPEWDGTPLEAGTLLILGEQGVGDEIMFASCYPDALAQAASCAIECDPRLAPLFARSFPRAQVYGQSRQRAHPELQARRDIRFQIHAGSLPRFFRRDEAAFPRHEGYLVPDPLRVEHWRRALRGSGPRRVLGVAWSGGVLSTRRALRSLAPASMAPLLQGVDADFVSLQHDDDGSGAAALAALSGARVHAFPDTLQDLDETCALLAALDGVLTVCSSVVHLAGSLGVPTLVLTPYVAEWRYRQQGSAMPWYPSVRLLRQTQRDRWDEPFATARAHLLRCASGGKLLP